jgi:hypothetical protein
MSGYIRWDVVETTKGEKMKIVRTSWDFFRSVFHNVVVHPILPFLPRRWAKWLHEKNGAWAYPKGPFDGLD